MPFAIHVLTSGYTSSDGVVDCGSDHLAGLFPDGIRGCFECVLCQRYCFPSPVPGTVSFTDTHAKQKQNVDGRARVIHSARASHSGEHSASPAVCGSGSGLLRNAGAALEEVVVVVVVVTGPTGGGLRRRWEDW